MSEVDEFASVRMNPEGIIRERTRDYRYCPKDDEEFSCPVCTKRSTFTYEGIHWNKKWRGTCRNCSGKVIFTLDPKYTKIKFYDLEVENPVKKSKEDKLFVADWDYRPKSGLVKKCPHCRKQVEILALSIVQTKVLWSTGCTECGEEYFLENVGSLKNSHRNCQFVVRATQKKK